MPYDLHNIKTSDFVRLDARGKVDVERSREVLGELANTCACRGVNCALLDVRDLHSEMTMNDLYSLAKTFRAMGFRPDQRLAVLHRYRSERAESFTTFAANEGWDVRGFEDYEEAIEWFSSTNPAK